MSPKQSYFICGDYFVVTAYFDAESFIIEQMDNGSEAGRKKPGATYKEIRAWVKNNLGMTVSNLNVAQAKDQLGLGTKRQGGIEASGKWEQAKLKAEKLDALETAFRHFGMI